MVSNIYRCIVWDPVAFLAPAPCQSVNNQLKEKRIDRIIVKQPFLKTTFDDSYIRTNPPKHFDL